MIGAFLSGEDIHTATSCRVFGVAPEDVTVEMRKRAKAVNFGILYGMGEYSLAEDLKISRAQAKEYIDSYLSSYPAIDEYLHNVAKDARADGYVTTISVAAAIFPSLPHPIKICRHSVKEWQETAPFREAQRISSKLQ